MHLNGTSSENCWPILAGVGSSAGSSRGNRAGLGRAWPGLGHNRIVIVIIVYEKSHSFLVLRWDAAMAGNAHWTNKFEFVQNLISKLENCHPSVSSCPSMLSNSWTHVFVIVCCQQLYELQCIYNPITAMGFFSNVYLLALDDTKSKHCRHPIAVTGVVDRLWP